MFKAPTTGFYRVSCKMLRFVPNGKKKTVPNWNRRFWEFWKEKTREIDDGDMVESYDGQVVVLLQKDEQVQGPIMEKL
jgi:hypothetical protein